MSSQRASDDRSHNSMNTRLGPSIPALLAGDYDETSHEPSRPISLSQGGSRPEGVRDANHVDVSPFLQTMVQAADRIAQGPVLDLASSLHVARETPSHVLAAENRTEVSAHSDQHLRGSARNNPPSSASSAHDEIQSFSRQTSHRDLDSSIPLLPNYGAAGFDTQSIRQEQSRTTGSSNSVHHSSNDVWNVQNETTSLTGLPSSHERFSFADRNQLSERSNEARRGLERALRDYRMARRALRTHHQEDDEARETFNTQHARLRDSLFDAVASLHTPDAPISSSVPTVAALRAARPSRQESSDSGLDSRPTYASVASSTEPSGLLGERNSAQDPSQPQRISIIGDLRRSYWQPDTSPGIDPALQNDTLASRVTNSGVNPSHLNADSRRRLNASLTGNRLKPTKPEETASRRKAKNTMRYLTELKTAETKGKSTIEVAQNLGIDSMKESLERGSVFDLPLRLDELPRSGTSSWLECGVCWSGEQVSFTPKLPTAGARNESSSRPVWAQVAGGRGDETDRLLGGRARRHRERVRAERIERERQLSGGADPLDQSRQRFSGVSLTGSMEILADMERHLSDLLEEEERRLNPNDGWTAPESLLGRRNTGNTDNLSIPRHDKWPVQVTLHEVDWASMTVKGTMSASEIPDRTRPSIANTSETQGNPAESRCVDSFFDGEIVDFRHNEIETLEGKEGYKSGGLAVDLQYWAGLGPFREEVERQKNVIRYEKQIKTEFEGNETESGRAVLEVIKSGTRDCYESIVKSLQECAMIDESDLDQDENDRAIDQAMIKCLGSRKWLEERLAKEWVLMRWKERCFVTPTNLSSATIAEARRSASITTPAAPLASSSAPARPQQPNDHAASWGLTISGFYYIALHRETGKIEGLYYDPGSQPYQRLEMWPAENIPKHLRSAKPPETSSRHQPKTHADGSRRLSNVNDRTMSLTDWTWTEPKSTASSSKSNLHTQKEIVGVRKWFPAIEFRE